MENSIQKAQEKKSTALKQGIAQNDVTQMSVEMENSNKSLLSKTMWNDAELMNMSFRTAQIIAGTSIIPQQYRGKPGDCLIAIDMANRMGISPIMVMQSSQVVQGNFTWRGTACRALIDGCGKFKNSRYVMVGKANTDTWGCRLVATRTRTGEVVSGPTVTMKMALDEGWVHKNGSKWKTMPELMMRYRAASFFAKTECPEVLMGFQTAEEQMDIIDEIYLEKDELTASSDDDSMCGEQLKGQNGY